MKENKILRLYMNGIFTVKDVNEELEAGWTVQTAIPVGNGAVDYVLVKEKPDETTQLCIDKTDYERLSKEYDCLKNRLNVVCDDLSKENRKGHLLWKFMKDAYENSDNRHWFNDITTEFNVSKFREIFEKYTLPEALEHIQKFYTEEDETNDKEQSSED